jgi:hypothetical protein
MLAPFECEISAMTAAKLRTGLNDTCFRCPR